MLANVYRKMFEGMYINKYGSPQKPHCFICINIIVVVGKYIVIKQEFKQ